jgi:hypothetical protein
VIVVGSCTVAWREEFLANHADRGRCGDAQADLLPLDRQHGHADFPSDHGFLADTPGED